MHDIIPYLLTILATLNIPILPLLTDEGRWIAAEMSELQWITVKSC